jgi:hypothetical protein
MTTHQTSHTTVRGMRASALALLVGLALAGSAQAQSPSPIGLGTADSYAVLAGQSVTNDGPTVINGDLGVFPGSSVTGFGPGTVNGEIHTADADSASAQQALTAAYNDAFTRPCGTSLTGQDLGGLTLEPGVYCFTSTAGLTGNLTLNALGNPDAVFIFQVASGLTTATGSSVTLINGAQACNVFWQVGSTATLGSTTSFKGNILAQTSITVGTSATVEEGRLFARDAEVTLLSNIVTRARCAGAGGPDDGGGGGGGGGDDGPGGPDRRGPGVIIGGGPGDGIPGNPVGGGGNNPCVARDFRLRIRTRDRSGIRSVRVFVDGRLVRRSTRRNFLVWIRAGRLGAGRHRLRVVATDRRGNRSVRRRSFRRCAQPLVNPNFTG